MGREEKPWAVVTGGNRGIGWEVCRQLAERGARVLLAARDPAAGFEAAAALASKGLEVTARPLDVADRESVAGFAQTLAREGVPVEILVNNAGVALKGFNAEVVKKTLAVNLFGAMDVTEALLPWLTPAARIVMVSSGMGEISCLSPPRRAEMLAAGLTPEGLVALAQEFHRDVEAGRHTARGWPGSAYNFSKAALNTFVRILARQLEGGDVRVNAVCPGWVQTRMGGGAAPRTAAEATDTIVWVALGSLEGPRGAFLRDRLPIAW